MSWFNVTYVKWGHVVLKYSLMARLGIITNKWCLMSGYNNVFIYVFNKILEHFIKL